MGVKDNFFDLGGHSLLAVRLMTRLQSDFGQSLPLAAVFRGPTVEHLADALRQRNVPARNSCLVPIQTGRIQPPFYCVPGRRR